MHLSLPKLYVEFQNLTNSEEGQDLVEVMLLCSLVALAVIAGVNSIAAAVNQLFTKVSSSFA